MRVGREWSRFDTIGGVVILGTLVALVVWSLSRQFTFNDNHDGGLPGRMVRQLSAVRSQIHLYNVQNPETAFDATTPVGPAFWDPLVQNNYLQEVPRNWLQDNSPLVVASPRAGAGWVWAEWVEGFQIFAIDENGNFLDFDKDGRRD